MQRSRFLLFRLALSLLLISLAVGACDLFEEPADAPVDDAPDRIGDEGKAAAAAYLNQVRANPAAYSDEIGVDLSDVEPRPALRWDSTLAAVAQAKAEDMLARDYFAHVDPDGNGLNIKLYEAGYPIRPGYTEPRSANFFESLAFFGANYPAGNTGTDAIKGLIEDKDVNPPGHRYHLLGIGDFRDEHTEIGIGVAEAYLNGRYTFYTAVVIAHPTP